MLEKYSEKTIPKEEILLKLLNLTVVIPVKNEEKAIGKVIDELLEIGVRRVNILVVDGHSTDGTVKQARERGVTVIKQEGNGKGMAILTAVKYIDTPYMLVMDGDYTYNPSQLWKMLEKMDGHVEVIGYRATRENIPRLHRLGNWILTKTFNILFGTP